MSAVKQAIERQFATLVEAYREEVGYPPDEEAEEMLWWQAEHDVTVPFEDRSGSVSDETLRAFVAEMQDVLRAGVVNYLATRVSDLAAGVAFYGSAPNLEDVPKIKTPLLIQSAEVDQRINASWPAFEAALKAANVKYERHLYPGTQHGFHNDTTPRYDAAAAKVAWERTVAFFNRYVR